VQRTFSSFPSGLPGAALLFQRLSVGTLAAWQFGSLALHHPSIRLAAAALLATLSGLALAIGVATPIASALIFLQGLGLMIHHRPAESFLILDSTLAQIEFLVMSATLLFLGPGAYSLDAHLFGRREVSINGDTEL
jgi:uncharacterized membrane protein YphA (DoxX/SURF4 family)